MELQYHGANCISIATKQGRVVIDDNLQSVGLKSITKAEDISLKTNTQIADHSSRFVIDTPGEYEISGVSINGVAAKAHMDKDDATSATIYTILAGDLRLCVTGHIAADLSEEQLEKIGLVDILVVPVGNSGYTLDGVGALQVVKKIEPKIVIPTHYADKGVKYEVPQVELAESLKTLGMEAAQTVDKYKPKPSDLGDSTQLVVLERQ